MTRSTQDLVPHPKIKHLIGRWKPDSDDAIALRRSIQEMGILQPLLVTHDGYILDGVTRWQAAKALQLAEVPVEERAEAEALDIVLATELHRRHHTRSQLAFRLAPMIAEAWELARHREAAGRKDFKPADPAKSFRSAQHDALAQNEAHSGTLYNTSKTVAVYALELGVSVRLLEQAHELHGLFESHPEEWDFTSGDLAAMGFEEGRRLTFRDYFTVAILEHEMSLGGALTGLKTKLALRAAEAKGRVHTGGKPAKGQRDFRDGDVVRPRQLVLIEEAWTGVAKRWEYWQALDETERQVAGLAMADAIHAAPDEVLLALRKGVEHEIKHRKEQGGQS